MDIISLLRTAKSKSASDLHLVASNPPVLRIHGLLHPIPEIPPLTADDIDEALDWLIQEQEREKFNKLKELDFGCTIPDIGRLRCNAAKQQGTTTLVIRLLPQTIPDIETLMLPPVCRDLARRPRGMLIVSGPTGSGKSTTLAAMVNYLNNNDKRRIVTIEDPVEFIYPNLKLSLIHI